MNPRKIAYGIAIVALFLIPIFPLIIANTYFFPFITGKAFYFRILVEIAFASWVILAFYDARYRPRLNALTVGISIFALVTLIADLIGVNPLRSIWSNFERMEGWLVVAHLWMFYMVISSLFGTGLEGRRMWHRWLNTSLVVAIVVAGYGFGQLFGWFDIHQSGARLDASLGNSAYMAVYMLFHAFIAGYLFFVARAKQIANAGFLVWLYPILAIVFSFIIFQTQTRGTILGLIGGVMVWLALYAIFGDKDKGASSTSHHKKDGFSLSRLAHLSTVQYRAISAGLIGLIILIGAIFWMNREAQFVQNSQVLSRLASISWSSATGQARNYVWPMAIKGAMERPILGWGQENFNYIFNANYEPKMWGHEQWFDRAHSVYLDWLVAGGIVGLISYLSLYVLLIMAIWRRSGLTVAEKSVLTGLIAGYAVHNVFVFDNLASYAMFFAMLGFGSSLFMTDGKSDGIRSKWLKHLETKEFSNDAVEYVVAPIVIVALVVGIYFLNVRPIQANTRLISALRTCSGGASLPMPESFERALSVDSYLANQEIREQILSCAGNVISSPNVPMQTKQAFYTLANQAIGDQNISTPDDARMYVLGGSFMVGIGAVEEAVPLLERALELTPTKQTVAFQLATVYMNTNKFAEAEGLLKNAYDSDPTYPDARFAYALGLIANNKEAEVRLIFADYPEIFETERMANAYTSLKQYSKAISIYQKLISADPTNIDLRARLAQVQYQAGQKNQAIATLRAIEKDNPELKPQIEQAIKEISN